MSAMSLPNLSFLDNPGPLAEQVAEALLKGVKGSPFDLSEAEVWVPTAGAARRIRHHLARISSTRGSGVLSPRFVSPMRALLPKGPLATREDREAAWGLALRNSDPGLTEHLFPRREVLEGEAALLGTAGMLCDLSDLLAEGGLTPEDPRIRKVCAEDEDRWREISPLYRAYLDVLRAHGLWDPNEARIRAWEEKVAPISSLTIVCLPDLTVAAVKKAESILKAGIPVHVLVWKPGAGEEWGGGFDAWGRPVPEQWAAAGIPLEDDQIVLARDPAEEASLALDFLSEAGGDHGLVLGDAMLAPAFGAAVLSRGGSPYLPEGEPLSHTEAAVLASGWMLFRRDRQMRTLRRLLESPRFAGWVGSLCGYGHETLLAACDFILLDLLAESLPVEPYPEALASSANASKLCRVMAELADRGTVEMLTAVWGGDPPEEVQDVLEICDGGSRVLDSWHDPERAREASITRALARGSCFGISRPGDLELSGWLEAPWSEARRLALCGCTEGAIPASTDAHPFLPDGKRRALGVPDNSTRRARDAYLLACLARSRTAGEFRCSFAKFGPEGSPSIPSNLLMRCGEEDLPARVMMLFGKARELQKPPLRVHDWKWNLPLVSQTPPRIGVTEFSAYLRCPFRYYLRNRLKWKELDPERREMDAAQFGTLLHRVLELYGDEFRDLQGRDEIAGAVTGLLDRLVMERHGEDPAPAVRVQAEAARVRLLSFAEVQARQMAAGWRIMRAELSCSGGLRFAGMELSGKFDRIEVNGDRIRVLDYKSQTKVKTPAEAHLEPVSRAFFPEAEVIVQGKSRAWVDLQLPLYRRIAKELFPGKTVETAYFVLAADPGESDVQTFALDDALMTSALACADETASRIARGIFWPPRQLSGSWSDPFGILLEGGRPEECLTPLAIEFLKGREAGREAAPAPDAKGEGMS